MGPKRGAILAVIAFVLVATGGVFAVRYGLYRGNDVRGKDFRGKDRTDPAHREDPRGSPGIGIELERTRCYGKCPAYTVRVLASGAVLFTGDSNVYAPGTHVGSISSADMSGLVAKFQEAHFTSLKDEYRASVTDMPSYVLRMFDGPNVKTVTDYDGSEAGMPKDVTALEEEVDRMAGTARWVTGSEQTLPALLAENWDFTRDNRNLDWNRILYGNALRSKNWPLVDRFLSARFPVDSTGYFRENGDEVPIICLASQYGEVELVKRMAALLPPYSNEKLVAVCAVSAVRSGHLDTLHFWLDHGAKPQAGKLTSEDGLLPSAISSGNPDMLNAVLAFGPWHDFTLERESLIEWLIHQSECCEAPPRPAVHAMIQSLMKAGADINGRNTIGATTLIMYAHHEWAVRELLADGADTAPKDQQGMTALNAAEYEKCASCVVLLRDAMARRSHPTPANPN